MVRSNEPWRSIPMILPYFRFLTCLLLLSTALYSETFFKKDGTEEPGNIVRGSFEKLVASGPVEVILKESEDSYLKVNAPEQLKNKIRVKIEQGIATIRFDENLFFGVKKGRQTRAQILVYTPGVKWIKLGGSPQLTSDHKLKQKSLEISKSGSSTVRLPLKVKQLKITSSGSGKVELRGQAQHFKLLSRGSARFYGKDFEVDHAEVSLSGSSKIVIHAKESLRVQISGSAQVRYIGEPSLKLDHIRGSGSVKPYE